MESKTEIKKRNQRKNNPEIVETVREAARNPGWGKVAWILSGSRKNYTSMNLKELDSKTKEGDTVVIPGKILSSGDLSKKVRICALSFSKEATEKIKKSKGEAVSILDEIKKNKKAEGVKILR